MTIALGRFARPTVRIAAALGVVALGVTTPATMADAGSYTSISGAGSSWASVAIDQWAQDLRPNGVVVNYNPIGSAAGREEWIQGQYDFAGSDPPFRNGDDELAGTSPEIVPYAYSYIPDTAGGTAFMYHIEDDGHEVTNLRLNWQVLMGIFTGKITNWDNPEITHIYGAQLPNLPITPVIRADGSGATYFFTRWMAHMDLNAWNAFCEQVHPGIKLPCPQTEFYPQFGNAKAENGSTNVANYINSSYGDGAIGYDEYAYALNSHIPVVNVLNPAGYFVPPSASNVAVALTKAIIDETANSSNFLQQDLDNVYTFTDPRSYPLSSYSYLITPRTPGKEPSIFGTPSGKGATLSTYVDYMLCAGQQQMAELGYSPLPLNLVQGGLLQSDHIPGHIPGPNINTLAGCNNPTFTNGKLTLLVHAPYPSPCQKVGTPLDCKVVDGKAVAANSGSGSGGSSNSKNGSNGSGSNNGSNGSNSPGSGTSGTGDPTATGSVTGTVVNLASDQASQTALGVFTAVAVVLAVGLPPTLAIWLRRRRQAHG